MMSIKQKLFRPTNMPLPDFRNIGVVLRVLLLVNLLAVVTVLVRTDEIALLGGEIIFMASKVELPLFFVLFVLYALAPWLSHPRALAANSLLAGVVCASIMLLWPLLATERDMLWRWLSWALGATAVTVFYFDYRNHLYSPALTEARLMALTARIRPHFLFNSLNAVLGVIRSDPRRAEQGLEELADLFRIFMRDKRGLVPLGDEIALCERYVNLEQLRLGDKLKVRWDVAVAGGASLDAVRVPPLLLQPLLENAVYHGIEPTTEGGEIVVRLGARRGKLWLEVDNPVAEVHPHHSGNKMALDNIRERLMLYYDLEAELTSFRRNDRYCVQVSLPLKRTPR
ncbi:MAG: histidine kinase [Azoarcus sp.]|nr:histidine kinase [Azoarcus sp.]